MWSLGDTGRGVVVASLDSGVDVNHPDLGPRWRGGTDSWFDPYGQHPTTPLDLTGHGTATMGVMVGGDAGGTTIGMAPGATWIAARIFNDSGSGTATAIHAALQWVLDPDGNPATDDAPDVLNNSWAYGSIGCNLAFQLDLQSIRASGILPVFAAGNFGPGTSTSVSPANYPESLAVGAVDNAGAIDASSSRGPSACGEPSTTYPEVVAPGVAIRTTDLFGLYQTSTGTSLAAPHVAGALALILAAHPGLTADQQAAALEASAVDLGSAGPDDTYGTGRLDVLAAHDWLVANPPPAQAPITSGVSLSPSASDGSTAVALSATVTSTGSTVAAAEYFVDAVGADATGCAISGSYGTASTSLIATIPTSGAVAPCADLAGLAERQPRLLRARQGCDRHLGRTGRGDAPGRSHGPHLQRHHPDPELGPGRDRRRGARRDRRQRSARERPRQRRGRRRVVDRRLRHRRRHGHGLQRPDRDRRPPPRWRPAPTPSASASAMGPATGAPAPSGVRTATLTVTSPLPDAIFSNGFETGAAPWGWTSRSTTRTARLNVTAGAALVGTLGLQAQGNAANYVQYTFGTTAQPATTTYDARFYFRPNGNTGANQDILSAGTTGGTTLFRVRYRWNGGAPQVQLQVGTGTANAAWAGIGNASNVIEVVWQSGTTPPAPRERDPLPDPGRGHRLRGLGAPGLGHERRQRTLEYFDGFASKRSVSPLIGTGS